MSRIQKLETIYQEQLKDHQVDNVSDFIQSIIDSDITKGKYARFLIESFLNDKFLEEDLIGGLNSTVGQAISLFHKHKNKLPENMRSVYALNSETKLSLYQSPGDLWNSVKQYQGELSGKELKKEEQEKIYRETEFVYKDEETGFQIVSPLTKESAKWWGKGTRWCTSAENNNMFWDYAKDAPLFVIIMPNNNGDKLQLWKYKNEIQFMDEADNKVSLNYIEKHWNVLEPICLWLNDLRLVPDKFRTPELCELAVKQNGLALEYVPENIINKELCEIAVQKDGRSLEFIPEKLRTPELCELAVKQDGSSLRFIQQKQRTIELCQIAIASNGSSLQYVPNKYITEEFYELAVKQNGDALVGIPEEFRTKELCELAVKQNGEALFYVPYELRTKELCEMAVKQSIYAIMSVPEKLKTLELCEMAVKQDKDAFKYIPNKYKTPQLCEVVVKQNSDFLRFVPKELRTPELCELAIKQDGLALEYVPDEYKTKELCEVALQKNKNSIYFIPSHLITFEVYKLIVQQNNKTLHCIPDKFQIPMDKYKKTFQEIKTFFPMKDVSLSYHHS